MGKILDRNEFKAERSGVFAQGVLTAAEMFFVEDAQQLRVERAAVTEHSEKDAGEFVRGGGDGRRGTESGAKTAKIVTQREWLRYKVVAAMRKALASRQRTLRVFEERILPPLMRLSGQSPSQEAKCREEGKRVICGPTSQKKASTAWALMPGIAAQIHSEDSVHLGGNIEGGLIALGSVFVGGNLCALLLGIEACEHGLDLLVASGNLALKMPVAFQGLLQAKEMLRTVIAHQTFGHDLATGFNARVAQAGEPGGFAFSQEDGIDNGQPAESGDVTNDIVQLEIHLGESLLHEKHLARSALEQGVAMAQNAANRANGLRGPERASQQSHAMEVLQPLAVLDVGFAPRHPFDMAGVDQTNFQPPALQDLKKGDPVNPCGFHSDRFD